MFNSVDSKNVDVLAMAGTSLIALSSFLLKNDCFLSSGVLFDSCVDSCILNGGPTDGSVVSSANHKDVIQANLLADFEWDLFY